MKRRATPVFFEGATSGNVLGHPVKIEGPQTLAEAKDEHECCIEIDGNVVMYEIGPFGIHSHSFMYQNFATPWELAEALARDYRALSVRGGPNDEVVPHHHDAGAPPHDHGTHAK